MMRWCQIVCLLFVLHDLVVSWYGHFFFCTEVSPYLWRKTLATPGGTWCLLSGEMHLFFLSFFLCVFDW